MKRRMIAPVGEKIIRFPESEAGDLIKGPAGNGGDVAEEEWPIG